MRRIREWIPPGFQRRDAWFGVSEAAQALEQLIARLARLDLPILIQGESGCGKEMVAQRIHADMQEKAGERFPYVAVNCAALSEALLESELFGHEAGAFTGASRRHAGVFEQANGGLLLLDEIGDMPLGAQAKLLRVLQDGQVRRVGGEKSLQGRVRLICATHKPLDRLVESGAFREDLYYRLAVVELRLPPLRERLEDVPLLFQKFVFDSAKAAGVPLRPVPGAYLADLMGREWPGNVRELRNAAERFVLGMVSGQDAAADDPGASFEQRVNAFERQLIVRALQRAGGRVSVAAAAMGLARKTLYDKMRKLHVTRSDVALDESDGAA